MLFDAHAHLQDEWLSPHRARIVAELARLPLAAAVVNGTSETDWPEVAALARAHSFVQPSYGLHPWHVGNATPHWRETLRAALQADASAAVGEIGLDCWILERARPDDPRLAGLRRASLEEQTEAFAWQLALAAERDRPVSIHCLDAWGPLAAVLRDRPRPARGFLLHAYGGSAEMGREFAALGGYFSFNGAFLADRHRARRSVFAALPADRLLVETDSPAMPLPAERRSATLPDASDGTPVNHPANIVAAYAGLAEIRNAEPAALEAQIEENFRRFFG